jgi:hypothetical protein
VGIFDFGGSWRVEMVAAPGGFGSFFSFGTHRSSRKGRQFNTSPSCRQESIWEGRRLKVTPNGTMGQFGRFYKEVTNGTLRYDNWTDALHYVEYA